MTDKRAPRDFEADAVLLNVYRSRKMGAFKVVLRNARVWRKYMVSSLVGNLGQPFLFLLAMGYGLGREIEVMEGMTYLQFIAPGLVASSVMYSAAFEATYGSYTRLSTQSTFEGILMTPITVGELALGEILWGACKGFLSGIIMLASLPLFGLIPSVWVLFLLPILFAAGIMFAALGLLMTAIAGSYEFFNYFISLFITPLFLFSGIFFSLDTLPERTRWIVEILPLTPVVDLSRMLCYGRVGSELTLQAAVIVILAAGCTWLASIYLKKRLIQ